MSDVMNAEAYRKDYEDKKKGILTVLQEAASFYENEPEKKEAFQKLSYDLQNGEFSIVVVGEFSAGKSSLLNALMKKRLLPSFTNETTATVNFLRHKEKAKNGESGRVYYNDGTDKELPDASLKTIEEYVSTRGNNIAETVRHLDLFLDSPFLEDGVTLVDSPGLNGVAEGHREITEQQILKSHASIFVFSSDHPGSATDFEFVSNLRGQVDTIFFLLNKIDNIKESEGETVESVIENLKENFKKKFPDATTVPEIWPVSAGMALASACGETFNGITNSAQLAQSSMLDAFENRLLKFLTQGEKAKQQLISPVSRVLSVTNATEKKIKAEQEILNSKIDGTELDDKINELDEIKKHLEEQIASDRSDVRTEVENAFRDVQEEISAGLSRLSKGKLNLIDSYEDLSDLIEYINGFEQNYVQSVGIIIQNSEESLQNQLGGIINVKFMEHAEEIGQKLGQAGTSVELKIDNHLELDEAAFSVSLKDMEKKSEELEAELKKTKEEADKAQTDYFKARENEKKREKLEREINEIKTNIKNIEDVYLPPIRHYTADVNETIGWTEGGLVYIPRRLLFGPKTHVVHKEWDDATEYNEAKNNRDERIKKENEFLEEKRNELRKYEDEYASSSEAEVRHNQLQEEMHEMSQKLADLQEKNAKQIDEAYKKNINKCKRIFTNYCDDLSEEISTQIRKHLRASKDSYANVISSIVESNLRKQVQEKQEQIERYKAQISQAESDKQEQLTKLEERLSQLSVLREKAIELYNQLESLETDVIQKTAL
ncbi:MAG: dynamin family protein [Treponema sp.]|nr:dynamin family protein [Treponema sp.]